MSTEDQSVPGAVGARDHDPTPPPPTSPITRRRVWPWWVAAATFLAAAAALFAAFTVRIGQFEFRPGSARPTSGAVEVGDGVTTFPPASDIAFTTVSLRQSTVASYVAAWFDEDVEVVEDDLILGDRSPQENRQFNLQLMDTSKQDAIRVALLELGYEVPVTVDGVVIVRIEEGSAAEGRLEVGEAVVSVDGRGGVTLHWPEGSGPAAELESGRAVPLPHAYRLDDAPGFERFFLVTGAARFDTGAVLEAARRLAASGRARTDPLPLAAGLEQRALVLIKERR